MNKLALLGSVLALLFASCSSLSSLAGPPPSPTAPPTATPRPTRTPTPRPTITRRPTATPIPPFVDLERICLEPAGARYTTEGYVLIPKQFHEQAGFYHIGLTTRPKNFGAAGNAALELWFSSRPDADVAMMVVSPASGDVHPDEIFITTGGGFMEPGGAILLSGYDMVLKDSPGGAHVSVAGRVAIGADLAECYMIVEAITKKR